MASRARQGWFRSAWSAQHRPVSAARTALAFAVIVGATGCSVSSPPTRDAAPIASPLAPRPPGAPTAAARPVALVYRGQAGCDGCSEAVVAWLGAALPTYAIGFVGPGEATPVRQGSLASAALYVQPGGDGSVAEASVRLTAGEQHAIAAWVRAGGRYLGICQGAYLAGSDPGMGLLSPADTGEYIASRGATTTRPEDALVPLRWEGRTVYAYFQDGPYVGDDLTGVTVIARYTNGRVAAAAKNVGAGRVAVIGTHPEAPLRWYALAGLSPADRAANQAVGDALLAVLLR